MRGFLICIAASSLLGGCAFSEGQQKEATIDGATKAGGPQLETPSDTYQIKMPFLFGEVVTIKRGLSRNIYGNYYGTHVVYLHYQNQTNVEVELTFQTAPQLPDGQIRGRWSNGATSSRAPTFYDAGINDVRVLPYGEGGAKIQFRAIIPASHGFVGASIALELEVPRVTLSYQFHRSEISREALSVADVEAAGVSISDQMKEVTDNGSKYELVGGLKLVNSSGRDSEGMVPFDLPVQKGSRESAWGWRNSFIDPMVLITPEYAAGEDRAESLSISNIYYWFGVVPRQSTKILLVYRKWPIGLPKSSSLLDGSAR